MYLGIDTSNAKKFGGIVLGEKDKMDMLYHKFQTIYTQVGFTDYLYFSELTPSQKQIVFKESLPFFNELPTKCFLFRHTKPSGMSAKEFYLSRVPSTMAEKLVPFLEARYGFVSIDVDDDYFVAGTQDGTHRFLRRLMNELVLEIHGGIVKPILSKDQIKMTINNKNGKQLTLYGHKSGRYSRYIQITDTMLGLYNYSKSTCPFIEEIRVYGSD